MMRLYCSIHALLICHGALHAVIHSRTQVPPVPQPSYSLPYIHTTQFHQYYNPHTLSPIHTYCLLSSTSTTTLILSPIHTYCLLSSTSTTTRAAHRPCTRSSARRRPTRFAPARGGRLDQGEWAPSVVSSSTVSEWAPSVVSSSTVGEWAPSVDSVDSVLDPYIA
jgi:hypothetical protein